MSDNTDSIDNIEEKENKTRKGRTARTEKKSRPAFIVSIVLFAVGILAIAAVAAFFIVYSMPFTVVDGEESSYVIFYGTAPGVEGSDMDQSDMTELNNEAARYFTDTIYSTTDVYIPTFEDTRYDGEAKVIVFGASNLIKGSYTAEETAAISEDYFEIRTDSNKIFVTYSNLSAAKGASDYIRNQYLDDDNNTLKLKRNIVVSGYQKPSESVTDRKGEIIYTPVVCAVDDEYQIIFASNYEGLAYVEVDGVRYNDERSGLVNSDTLFHKISVPCDVLDSVGSYTVYFKIMYDRKPYRPQSGRVVSAEYQFRPIDTSDGLQIFALADTHNDTERTVQAASYYGDKIDLLVLCGDAVSTVISNDSYLTIFKILSDSTKGSIPVVYTRGNHETRGQLAEHFTDYMPADGDNTYYTFRVGSVWGIVLDCGEDKVDSNVEYGGVAAFERMRNAQTEFLREIIANKDSEYYAEGVEYRVGVCHVPFITRAVNPAPEIFAQWRELVAQIDLDIMINGHNHRIIVDKPAEYLGVNIPYHCVLSAAFNEESYKATAIEFVDGNATVSFVDNFHTVISSVSYELTSGANNG